MARQAWAGAGQPLRRVQLQPRHNERATCAALVQMLGHMMVGRLQQCGPLRPVLTHHTSIAALLLPLLPAGAWRPVQPRGAAPTAGDAVQEPAARAEAGGEGQQQGQQQGVEQHQGVGARGCGSLCGHRAERLQQEGSRLAGSS
jgi:hypothetical protein